MKKQLWVKCDNVEEEKRLFSKYPAFKVIYGEKQNFPFVVDFENKIIFRCESVSCCAAYVSSGGKITKYDIQE